MDFGGGKSIVPFFAVHSDETCNCNVVDPFDEGLNSQMSSQYHQLSRLYGSLVRLHNDIILRVYL
jgi:hypothetical protein